MTAWIDADFCLYDMLSQLHGSSPDRLDHRVTVHFDLFPSRARIRQTLKQEHCRVLRVRALCALVAGWHFTGSNYLFE